MNILSLFDGGSCGQQALKELEIPINTYYSSEIDDNAIAVTQFNHPNTIQLGNIQNWRNWNIDWKSIDLVIGGSPCQGFSIAGKKLNFDDPRSKLFFDYLEILNHLKSINPNIIFLLENVATMDDDIADKIDELIGVKRTFLDSRYFTGMIRKRYYWTNLHIDDYEKLDLNIEDLIDDLPYDRDMNFLLDRTIYNPSKSYDGIITLNPRNKNGKQTWQRGRVYDVKGKCPTICTTLFDLNISKDHKTYRKLTIEECERLQGLPKGYTSCVPKLEAGKILGNGWNVKTIKHIFNNII